MPPRLSPPFAQVQVFAPRVFEVGGLTPVQIQNGAGYSQPIARLRPGVSLKQAASELAAIEPRYKERVRVAARRQQHDACRARSSPSLVGNLEPTFYTLLGAVSFVLLIACANVASLFLGRLTARHKEIAVRQAIGATRTHVVRQFLVESLVFSIVAGALGVLLALWALSAHSVARRRAAAAQHDADAELARARLHRQRHAADRAAGRARAGASTRRARNSSTALKDSARGSSGERGGRFRATLIVAEVALSVVLLVGSSLLLISFLKLQRDGVPDSTRKVSRPRSSACRRAATRRPRSRPISFAQVIERLRAQPASHAMPRRRSVCRLRLQPALAVQRRRTPDSAAAPASARQSGDRQRRATSRLMRIPLVDRPRVHRRRSRGRPGRLHHQRHRSRKRLFPGESPLGQVLLRGRDAEIRGRDRRRDSRRQDQRPQRRRHPTRSITRCASSAGPAWQVVGSHRLVIRRRCRSEKEKPPGLLTSTSSPLQTSDFQLASRLSA